MLAAALIASVSGCGESSPTDNGIATRSPAQILAAAESAAGRAVSVHVKGSILSEGTPISLQMELLPGKGGSGELELGGDHVDLVTLDRLVYVKADERFYRGVAGAAAARALGDRWLRARASVGPFAPLARLASAGQLIDGTLANHGALTNAGTTTLDGRPVVAVRDPAHDATLYVAATGPPYPLEIRVGGAGHSEIVFDRWNKRVTLTPPTNPIDAEGLQLAH